MDKYNVDLTEKAKKSFKKLNGKDNALLAEVKKKLDLLAKGEFDSLTIKLIVRKKKTFKIKEIVIKSPNSYRIFYIHILERNNEILIVDGRKKKARKFSSSYFDKLDICIKNYLTKN